MAESIESWLDRLFNDPRERERVRAMVQLAKTRGCEFLREIGIDPKQDAIYLGVGGIIATAIAADDLSDSSKRLEEANHELLSKTHELVTETKVLKALTAILAILTAVLVWRTFLP
jgi:hypothetical protein